MLQIINFFKYIYEFLSFIVGLLYNLLLVIISIPAFIVKVFGALPTLISAVIIGLVAVCIVYKVISLGGAGE